MFAIKSGKVVIYKQISRGNCLENFTLVTIFEYRDYWRRIYTAAKAKLSEAKTNFGEKLPRATLRLLCMQISVTYMRKSMSDYEFADCKRK